ncbi:hypothetical protein [Oceanobacillus sp. CAU 1775]
MIVEITGEEMLLILEENIENTFSSNPYNQIVGYLKRCLRMNLFIKLENPKNMRIQDLFIGNERIEKNRTYLAAFGTAQAVPKKYGENHRHLEIHTMDALKQYIEKKKTVSPTLRNKVKLI